jgi:hypothetical protein
MPDFLRFDPIRLFTSVKLGRPERLTTVSRLFGMNDKFARRFMHSLDRNDSSTEKRYSSGRYISSTPRGRLALQPETAWFLRRTFRFS